MESPKLKKDDIVILMYMEDPDSIEPLTLGRVIKHSRVFGDDQYDIDWENGRKLSLISSVDRWETEESLIEKGNEKLLRIFRKKMERFNK
jgi:hypothetical protein